MIGQPVPMTGLFPGHWEGDLILGAGNKSAIGTLVERSTRFTILLHLPHRHDSYAVQEAIIHKMRHLPAVLRNTLTWDQDSEMALHSRITTALDMQMYSQTHLNAVAEELNDQPRKTLNYDKPSERILELIS